MCGGSTNRQRVRDRLSPDKVNGGDKMKVAMVLDLPGVTDTQYAIARSMLGDSLQPGSMLHVAGPTEDGWRVMEIWQSPEMMGAFFQSAAARQAFQAAGISPAKPVIFPVSAFSSADYCAW
jgi:hypothetical protein